MKTRIHPQRRTARGLVGLTSAALVLLTACNSSGDSIGGTGDTDPDAITAAAARVEAAKKAPTSIPLTEPLPSAPPEGKAVVWLNCDIPSCSIQGEALQEAVESAGWTFSQINYSSGDPATLTAGLERALETGPDYVSLSGVPPESGWQSVIADYEAANVPIVTNSLADPVDSPVVYGPTGGGKHYEASAELIADWFIADSEGKGHAVLQGVDGFPVLKTWGDAFKKHVVAECPGCTLTPLPNTVDQALSGDIVSTIVPALQRNAEAEYLITSDLEFMDALPAALKAANLDVKVAGDDPGDKSAQASVRDGVFSAEVTRALRTGHWLVADIMFRLSLDLPIPDEDLGVLPMQLLTPDVEFDIVDSRDFPADYPDQFKKLWQVG